MQAPQNTARPRGRPRGFETQDALEAAMKVFWSDGYDGASVDHLCRATAMPRASLYHDYDGKQGIFLAAVAHYVDTRLGPIVQALGPRGTLAEDLTAFFDAVIALATADDRTRGCLISCVLADAAGAREPFRAELEGRFQALEDRIADRLTKDGDPHRGPRTVARAAMLAAVARGLMLRARAGAGPETLSPIAAVTVESVISPD